MKESVLNCLQNDMTQVLPTGELGAKKSMLTLKKPLGMVPAITGLSSRWGSVRNWGTSWEACLPRLPHTCVHLLPWTLWVRMGKQEGWLQRRQTKCKVTTIRSTLGTPFSVVTLPLRIPTLRHVPNTVRCGECHLLKLWREAGRDFVARESEGEEDPRGFRNSRKRLCNFQSQDLDIEEEKGLMGKGEEDSAGSSHMAPI